MEVFGRITRIAASRRPFSPDNFYTEDLGQTQILGIEGSYITNEAYFETLLPIFSGAGDSGIGSSRARRRRAACR